MIHIVEARKSHLHEPKLCDWIGGNSYKCPNCQPGLFKVRSEDAYDAECPSCKSTVEVRRRYGFDPYHGSKLPCARISVDAPSKTPT